MKVRYDGNIKETYTLFYNEKEVAELFVGEDGAIEITAFINVFLKEQEHLNGNVVIQNDGDKFGVIVDIYVGDEHKSGITLWFDDF